MSFVSESTSSGFGVSGVAIEQTLLEHYDVYSGMDINLDSFQNTNQGLKDSNQDGRIALGMFSFDDDNNFADSFPDILRSPFKSSTKPNLITNGDCKFVRSKYVELNRDGNNIPFVVEPDGDWRFLSLRATPGPFQGDVIGNYVPLSLELNNGDSGINYWGRIKSAFGTNIEDREITNFFASTMGQDIDPELHPTGQSTMTSDTGQDTHVTLRGQHSFIGNGYFLYNEDSFEQDVPHIAMWITTPEAYSNNRCLCFMNFQEGDKMLDYINREYADTELGGNGQKYIFNWFLMNNHHGNGRIKVENPNIFNNGWYRVLNQAQNIYDKFNDNPINPYSSLKIKFKMKTTNAFIGFDGEPKMPKIDVGILGTQFHELPKSGKNSLPYSYYAFFEAPGSFNSLLENNINYLIEGEDTYENTSFESRKDLDYGGTGRFQNKEIDEWEDFEFTFNLTDDHLNDGLIHGIPYGGTFDDEANGGPVEIQLNTNSNKDKQPGEDPGEIFFKVPGYDRSNPNIDFFYIIHPNGTQRRVRHAEVGKYDEHDINTVASALGDTGGVGDDQRTGLQNDGRILEAYLMYVGTVSEQEEMFMADEIDYGDSRDDFGEDENHSGPPPHTAPMDLVVAYWNGERWTYDDNSGYSFSRQFTPDNTCFILARLYTNNSGEGDTNEGISGMEQYISNESQFPTDGVGNLTLFLQTESAFEGRVLIDNIECYESYEFTPDVDVRKKISVGNYGTADLTKYYDKELQPQQYKDSQAPLEAQFYFYPTYPIDETFGVTRTPIYQDFKFGRFYIHDIDWGDGSPNEFTSTPQQIDEDTALYHTYETSGIFEVTGTMMRVKTDKDNNIIGIPYNKKFKLVININEGLDEDFRYFGSDGYSFIPYKNTTPIIGGISDQSNYYKKTKRQLGFLDNEKISIDFKYDGDKLKTELALLKMENQIDSNLEVLPSYMTERISEKYNLYQLQPVIWPEGIGEQFFDAEAMPGEQFSYRYEVTKDSIPEELQVIYRFSSEEATQEFLEAYVIRDIETGEWKEEPEFGLEDFEIIEYLQEGKIYKFDFFNPAGTDSPDMNTYYNFNNFLGINWDLLPSNPVVYKGISPIREELGKGIGDCDLTCIKYYNEPKSIWELFGFEEDDLREVGAPDNERYWKNIIPQNYSFKLRNGLTNELEIRLAGTTDGLGTLPHYNVIINGVVYYDEFLENAKPPDTNINNSDFENIDFNIPIDRSLDVQEIKIEFDNDSNAGGGDMNLFVMRIAINGVTFDGSTSAGVSTHDDINVYYDSPNVYNFMENYPDQTSYNENGVSELGAMAWRGSMVFEIPTKYFNTQINESTNQDWDDGSYYPVLPKHGANGKFIKDLFPISVQTGNTHISFPLNGKITDEYESGQSLLLNITNQKIEIDTLNDVSGNKNYGFFIEDFSPEFDNETLQLKKSRQRGIIKTTKVNGAF
tara:strand:+ start:1942 stop:6264 length:4323 start_codon:yes stop_codon:yes gene_type:complete